MLVDLCTGVPHVGEMSFIQNFLKRHMPVVKAEEEEEELVDPQKVLRVSNNNRYIMSGDITSREADLK